MVDRTRRDIFDLSDNSHKSLPNAPLSYSDKHDNSVKKLLLDLIQKE